MSYSQIGSTQDEKYATLKIILRQVGCSFNQKKEIIRASLFLLFLLVFFVQGGFGVVFRHFHPE